MEGDHRTRSCDARTWIEINSHSRSVVSLGSISLKDTTANTEGQIMDFITLARLLHEEKQVLE